MRSDGYKTKGRQEILKYLIENSNKAVTVREIYQYIQNEDIKVSITTVYRYLDKLVSEGQAMKYVSDKGEKSGYQYVGESQGCQEHLHLQCIKCGRVIHLDCEFMHDINNHIMKHHSFNLNCANSILYGICEECGERKK